MKKRPAFLAAAAALAFASCWAPYYDPEVSASAGFADKLGEPLLSIGPLSGQGMFDSSGAGFAFYPSRPSGDPASPNDGFLVQVGDDRLGIAFAVKSGGGYSFAPMSQGTGNYFGSDVLIRSAASDASGNPQLVVAADHEYVRQYRYDRASGNMFQNNEPPSDYPAYKRIYGAGARLASAASDADLYVILSSDGSYLRLSQSQVDSSMTPFIDAGLNLAQGGFVPEAGGRAVFDTSGTYLYYGNPSGTTYRWTSATMATLPPVALGLSGPLVAVLSDGTLVTQDDLHIRAYTAGGQKLFSALAGTIRLLHEVYAPGPVPAAGYYVFFSQVLASGKADSDTRELSVRVWRCSLADFLKLGD